MIFSDAHYLRRNQASGAQFSFIVSKILNRPIKVDKFDPTLAADILDASYALS